MSDVTVVLPGRSPQAAEVASVAWWALAISFWRDITSGKNDF